MSQEGYLTFLDLFLIIFSLFSTYISLSNRAQNRKDFIVIFLTKFLKGFQSSPPGFSIQPPPLGFSDRKSRGAGSLATLVCRMTLIFYWRKELSWADLLNTLNMVVKCVENFL